TVPPTPAYDLQPPDPVPDHERASYSTNRQGPCPAVVAKSGSGDVTVSAADGTYQDMATTTRPRHAHRGLTLLRLVYPAGRPRQDLEPLMRAEFQTEAAFLGLTQVTAPTWHHRPGSPYVQLLVRCQEATTA